MACACRLVLSAFNTLQDMRPPVPPFPSYNHFPPPALSHNATIYVKCSTQFDMTKELSTCHHCAHYYCQCAANAMNAACHCPFNGKYTHTLSHTPHTHSLAHTHTAMSACHCMRQRVDSTPTIGMHNLSGLFYLPTLLLPPLPHSGHPDTVGVATTNAPHA